MSNSIKRIAVFTSGGDAPGMNAAIRAVVRTAAHENLHVYGVYRGYQGLIEGELKLLEKRDVGNIIQRGGTMLKSARSQEFRTPEGRKLAFESIQAFDIDACIAIGGDGTFTGAHIFQQEYGVPVIGIPGTIDNDLYGTDYTIGYDTAVNTALEAVDKIRDTADSHDRLFFIEVMGRHAGFIALSTGISSGAECILVPEAPTTVDMLVEKLKRVAKRKKLFSLVIVAEGSVPGGAMQIAEQARDLFKNKVDIRVSVIGHIQRGGAPSSFDRILASRLGYAAVQGLLEGRTSVMVGMAQNKIAYVPFEQAISTPKPLDDDLLKLADVLAI